MEFNINHPILFVLAGVVIIFVLAQSFFFLIKAWKHGREIGMDNSKLKKVAITAGVFTIAPAVAIVISVITLARDLGVALPWLRLSVIGSLSYESVAAQNALAGMGLSFGGATALTAQQFVTIAFVMTISILVGPWLVIIVCKRMRTGLMKMEAKDKKWTDILSASLFVGMISAFLGFVFCDFSTIFHGSTVGLVPVCVMAVSAIVMLIAGLVAKKTNWRWISDYALPISLIVGMASAIPITNWLG